jgi:hypothetical protein
MFRAFETCVCTRARVCGYDLLSWVLFKFAIAVVVGGVDARRCFALAAHCPCHWRHGDWLFNADLQTCSSNEEEDTCVTNESKHTCRQRSDWLVKSQNPTPLLPWHIQQSPRHDESSTYSTPGVGREVVGYYPDSKDSPLANPHSQDSPLANTRHQSWVSLAYSH